MLKYKSSYTTVTPSFPTRLTSEDSTDVHNSLEVNAMVFGLSKKLFFLFSIDTLFISTSIKNLIYDQVNKNFDQIPESDIWIVASHTHFAPSQESLRFNFGLRDEQYFLFFRDKVIDLITNLKKLPFKDAEIRTSQGTTKKITANRRRRVRTIGNYFKPFISMEVDYNSFQQEEIGLLQVVDKSDQEILGVIWNFSCHPTNLYDKSLVSSEFPGEVRGALRGQKNLKSLPIVYLQGFAGNIRAYPDKPLTLGKTIRQLFQLSYPVKYYRFKNEKEYSSWCNLLIDRFLNIYDSTKTNVEVDELNTKMYKTKIENTLGISVEGVPDLVFRKINFGQDLAFVALSAEVVAEYKEILRNLLPEKNIFFVGYVDEVFGYLPTNKQIEEGGYESAEYFDHFLVSGSFNLDVENSIKSCVKKIS